ncbi:MAG: molybdopterin cofactor-binding domain-containing protein, partial [Rhodospirillaceae bacterium]
PYTYVTGLPFEKLSHHQCLDKILGMIDYPALRKDQEEARKKSIHRGIGFASMIEVTNPSPAFYGAGGAFISSQEGCTIRMDHTGEITCTVGVTEQGQGSDAVIHQVTASAVGVPMDKVRVVSGDTDVVPYGGGTWASRAAGIGGEAALQAGVALREQILEVAGMILLADPGCLDIRNGVVVDAADGNERLPLSEVGRIVYFRGDTLPADAKPELVATRHYVPRKFPFTFTNGIECFYVEVDVDTGFVKLLKCWVVDDCGTVINPMLVDEQVRGGVVQGIGGAMYEECLYDAQGQYLNATMADYLVPMAGEMPDIEVGHVETPTTDSELGAKGVGEAGTAGAPAAIMNAINDALSPFNAEVAAMPFTPERILRALGKV